MLDSKCSFPKNESLIKSLARLIAQLRFLIIWAFLKVVRCLRPNKSGIYQKDFEYIESANKIYKIKFRMNCIISILVMSKA